MSAHLREAWRQLVAEIEQWQDQLVMVDGKWWRLGDVHGGKLYHGSTIDLPVGALLEPGHGRNFDQSAEAVSITSLPDRAVYWAKEAGGPVYVYEIEPIGEVTAWRMAPADYGKSFQIYEARVPQARIVDRWGVGKLARGDYAGGHQPMSDAPPLHDLVGEHSWFPDDVYDHPEYYGFGEWTAMSARVIREVRGKPDALVSIYRSVPPKVHRPMQSQGVPVVESTEPVIEDGNWVSLSLAYARQHGAERGWEEWVEGEGWVTIEGDWPVVAAKVPAHTVRNGGNDIVEWGYWGPTVRGEFV